MLINGKKRVENLNMNKKRRKEVKWLTNDDEEVRVQSFKKSIQKYKKKNIYI